MTEAGGPTTQTGIRYQDQVAALYLGRMLDPRDRPRRDQPVEVRLEAPEDVDDFVVRFADGARRFFQVKVTLSATGKPWTQLWSSLRRQLEKGLQQDDRLELVLGTPSTLASNLRALTQRRDSADLQEWRARLTKQQLGIAKTIADVYGGDLEEVRRIFDRLEVSVWPCGDLERDMAPLWMPASSIPITGLFRVLTELALEASTVRARLDGAELHDRLRRDAVAIADPPHWGASQYRDAVEKLARIEVPGTGFRPAPAAAVLWPRCVRYDRDRPSDFDDDLYGWAGAAANETVELQNFPGADLDAVIVVAGPGFGKSTLIQLLARQSAKQGLLPVIVSIPQLSESDLSIADFLASRINAEFAICVDWRAASDTGMLVLLLDGLDEVSSDRRAVVLERLNLYRAGHPSVRWLMTVRDAAALAPPGNATLVELVALSNDDIERYAEFYRPGEKEVAPRLLRRMQAKPDLEQLVRIPVFLALMLVLNLEREDLSRSDLLDHYLESLFRPQTFKAVEPDSLDTAMLRRIAERAAFEALETDTVGVSIRQLERSVSDVAPALRTDDVREALVRRGVLRKAGLTKLNFPFPIVQEYFASMELLSRHGGDLSRRLSLIARRPWAQAIQFALERHPAPAPLVEEILDREDDVFHTGIRLLGRCLSNGMSITPAQWQMLGDRLAEIWGRVPFRTGASVDNIILVALAKPLHPAIGARLGERSLLHHGSGLIIARQENPQLALDVLDGLLAQSLEHLWNLGEFQVEVDRLGTQAFDRYIARARVLPLSVENGDALGILITHMALGTVDPAYAAKVSSDEELPPSVRIAAWRHSSQRIDATELDQFAAAINSDSYSQQASLAKVLAQLECSAQVTALLLSSQLISDESARKMLPIVVLAWPASDRLANLHGLLRAGSLSDQLEDLVHFFAAGMADVAALDSLIDRIPDLSAELVGSLVMLFGIAPERDRVERAVAAINAREWSPKDRASVASSFATGLTCRMEMLNLGTGLVHALASPHPGRRAACALLESWLACDDYEPWARLQLHLSAAQLGVASAIEGLRPALDDALRSPARGESHHYSDASLAGRALEVLHASRAGLNAQELERISLSASYNLAQSAIRLLAKEGGLSAVESLMRIYEQRTSEFGLVVLGVLEPLAGRLGLRITRAGARLIVSSAQ